MTATVVLRNFVSKMSCSKCGDLLISPERTYDFSEEGLVVNLWSCVNCGNQFETDNKIAHAASHHESKEKLPPVLLVA